MNPCYVLPLACRKCRQTTLQTYTRRGFLAYYRCHRCGRRAHYRLTLFL